MQLRVRYFDKNMPKIVKVEKGDWVDVRVVDIEVNSETVLWNEVNKISYKVGDVLKFHLGIAVQLPEGHEAWLLPRSSTFKTYGITLTNSKGIVDESYCGNEDEWMMMYLAHKSGTVTKYDRIGQFRIMQKMEAFDIIEVEKLENENRGGYGTTGVK
jgi:dUTP pyrophosphatase